MLQFTDFRKKPLTLAVSSLAAGMMTAVVISPGVSAQESLPVAPRYDSPVHIFSIDDLQTDFQGRTYGSAGTESDPDAICGVPGGTTDCPQDIDPATGTVSIAPYQDKQGVWLYPVDSAFGFNTVDFLGAEEKVRDGDYAEGFVGNITDGGGVIGIKIANAATATYKVKPPLGTWCQGLGGTSIKCSTEHYTAMEHVLSCHEVVPYLYANPVTGVQDILSFPGGGASYDCANAGLDDNLIILQNGEPTGGPLTSFEVGAQMDPNDNTSVLDDIATSTDYSVTLKDDGKPLYRWGSLIKRPNDVRLYAKIPLPAAWKEPGADYEIRSAKLIINHWITNNPNDQLRPEDLENEAATGRKPSYEEDGADWLSTKRCYEGDGDFLETEEGGDDPQPLGIGTVLKNGAFADENLAGTAPPQIFSADLLNGLTNAFYTTIDRDPFEWSYVDPGQADQGVFNFVGEPMPLTPTEMENSSLMLVSGPRWRLKANKFGQDVPGLEIPKVECSPPPFSNDNIKYEIGEPVTTVINLLDWDEEVNGPSPLATSKGWVDVTQNSFVTVAGELNGISYTTNGLPMTGDLDLAVYVKGDRKSTAVFNAQLVINEYEGVEPPPPVITPDDLFLSNPIAPENIAFGVTRTVEVLVNNSSTIEAVDVASVRFEADGELVEEVAVRPIDPGSSRRAKIKWTATEPARTVQWTMSLIFDGEVIDTAAATTVVRE